MAPDSLSLAALYGRSGLANSSGTNSKTGCVGTGWKRPGACISGGPTASLCAQKLRVPRQTVHGKQITQRHRRPIQQRSRQHDRWTQSLPDTASPHAPSCTFSPHDSQLFDARNGPMQPAHSRAADNAAAATRDIRELDVRVIKLVVLRKRRAVCGRRAVRLHLSTCGPENLTQSSRLV